MNYQQARNKYLKKKFENLLPKLKEDERIYLNVTYMARDFAKYYFNFVPVTEDGRLSAKDVLTRERLIDQQDKFQELVGQKYGLERGERGGKKQHLDVIAYKAATRAQEVDKLETVKEQLEQEKTALQGQIAALQGRLNNCNEFIARLDQIPKGKKTLLGKVEFTQQEATALVKTAETVYSARDTAKRAVQDAERMKDKVFRLESRPLERQVGELQQQNLQLKHSLEAVQSRLRKFDKALEKSPDLQNLFQEVLKSLERGRGLARGLER